MAKSWSGFAPQNQNVIEQWGVMEATTREIVDALHSAQRQDEEDPKDPLEAGDMFAGWPYDNE